MSVAPAQFGDHRHERYYEIITRRDPEFNGKFFTGVLTTGIYCLPSCGARTPKPENVRFFATYEEAERAGLRPCKRCRPDRLLLFEEERRLETVVEELRRNPDAIRGVEDLAARLDCGSSKLNSLFHAYFHATPAHVIASARIAWSQARLREGGDAGEVGLASGYESLSGFYEQFRRFTAMSPGEYRDIAKGASFRMAWPERFSMEPWLAYLGRDPESACEHRVEGGFEFAANLGVPAKVAIEFQEGGLAISVPDGVNRYEAHASVARLLGLGQDLDGFRAQMSQDEADRRLLPEGRVLRIPQTVTVWDGIVWAILGQQVNVPFAAKLRSRLARLAGAQVAPDLWSVPSPEAVARLTVEDLSPHQFSARKAEYLIGLAGEVVGGRLDLPRLVAGPATRTERDLLSQRGIGPWAANYILMRACGFMDATPIGDTGLTSALQRRFGGDRPDETLTKELMKRYAPYRSLATYHLWQSLRLGVG